MVFICGTQGQLVDRDEDINFAFILDISELFEGISPCTKLFNFSKGSLMYFSELEK